MRRSVLLALTLVLALSTSFALVYAAVTLAPAPSPAVKGDGGDRFVGDRPIGVAARDGVAWVANFGDGKVSRLHPSR